VVAPNATKTGAAPIYCKQDFAPILAGVNEFLDNPIRHLRQVPACSLHTAHNAKSPANGGAFLPGG
jgi:hypothetical protein